MQRAPAGFGIGLRRPHYRDVFTTPRAIDWFEIIPENYVGYGGLQRDILARVRERWPVVSHGVSTSVGGPDPFDPEHLKGLKALLDYLDPPYFTDHLCYAAIDGRRFHDLLPLPRTEEAVRHVAARARELADRMERPLALENISYYAIMPGGTMSEEAFITAVLEEADCGLLLDVNNVQVNAHNFQQDPFAALAALPVERTRQVHLAGYIVERDMYIDNHGAPVCDGVWGLYRATIERLGEVPPTLLEWDTDIPDLDTVLDQLDRAREVAAGYAVRDAVRAEVAV